MASETTKGLQTVNLVAQELSWDSLSTQLDAADSSARDVCDAFVDVAFPRLANLFYLACGKLARKALLENNIDRAFSCFAKYQEFALARRDVAPHFFWDLYHLGSDILIESGACSRRADDSVIPRWRLGRCRLETERFDRLVPSPVSGRLIRFWHCYYRYTMLYS